VILVNGSSIVYPVGTAWGGDQDEAADGGQTERAAKCMVRRIWPWRTAFFSLFSFGRSKSTF